VAGSLVDWDLAVATACRLVPPGPPAAYEEAAALVGELRSLAAEAEQHVRAFTRMGADPDPRPVSVVDRRGWVEANVAGFRLVLEPLMDRLLERRRELPISGMVAAVGSRVTGVQVGAILAYLASRVLGQYELFLPPGPEGSESGRLTLVAPNILATERALGVVPRDFRLWVCLHESTHRTQFTAVPWLRAHIQHEITEFLLASDLDPAAVVARLRGGLGAVVESIRGRSELSLLEIVQTPEQRAVLDRLTGLMSLVEGHGEYVMDGVGPKVVPSVVEIRRRFDQRRRQAHPAERVVRRLFGIDLKLRQYELGERFVRQVVDAVGMSGFNRVWESPETLPTRAEISAPAAWVSRVIGEPPAVTA
jgi:coenzyme F420 biosynthesis associated uncharacterized protein